QHSEVREPVSARYADMHRAGRLAHDSGAFLSSRPISQEERRSMKRALSVFVLLMFAASMSFAKTQKQDKDKYGVNAQGSQKITNGPVIESVSDHSAMIAWSTKSAAGT